MTYHVIGGIRLASKRGSLSSGGSPRYLVAGGRPHHLVVVLGSTTIDYHMSLPYLSSSWRCSFKMAKGTLGNL